MENLPTLEIVHVSINELKPATYNPRKHTPEATKHLKESIKRFGMVNSIVVNAAPKRKNIVIGGHFRMKICASLGHKTIPVVYVNIPDVEKEKELNLRLNSNVGEWDWDLLREFDVGFLLDVGFGDTDMSHIWDNVLEAEDDDFDVEKERKLHKKPKCKLGELYALGEHRLYVGDATDPESLKILMDGTHADMIYSDPPYNISLDYSNGIGTKGKYGGTTNDKKSEDEYRKFIGKTMKNALSVSKKDCHVFWWCDQKYVGLFQSLYAELSVSYKRTCLWVKNGQNPTPQVGFNKAYESCLYGTRGQPYLHNESTSFNEIMNKHVGTGNRLPDDIMDLFDIWLANRVSGVDYEHPTEKPPTLHEKPLRRCTKVGDIVLDLFGGSGSTLIACEGMKRRARLIEIEPIFADLIVRRYEALTGEKASRVN